MEETTQNTETATENTTPVSENVILDQLINLCVEKEASDIHFREGGRAALRVRGKIVFIENIENLSKEDTEVMINALMSSKDEMGRLNQNKEVDFSYTHKNGVNFRVNLFYQKGKVAGVMRMISKNIPSLDELGVPEVMKKVMDLKEGLVITCGNASSGKSTTIHSMLEHINQNSVSHILTVENPIEYIFEDKKSMFTQREVGKDTSNEASALKSALHEDVNVVMVGDVANADTLDKILRLVETGHLVIASMVAKDSAHAIDRMVSMYPSELRDYTKERLAENLTVVLAQDLTEKKDQSGLIAIFELMITNPDIQKIIKSGNFSQIKTTIQSSEGEGMIAMERYAATLAEQGIINI